jgi:hypothetical protein
MTNIQAAAIASPSSMVISQLSNQSFCSPRSRNIWNAPKAIARRAKPKTSKFRFTVSAFGMNRIITNVQITPTGRFTRKTQRQL